MNEAFMRPVPTKGEDGLPFLPVALLEVHNSLFKPRRPLSIAVGGKRYSVSIEAWRNPPAEATCLTLQTTVPLAQLHVPNTLARELLSGLTIAGKSPSAEGQALLMELAVVEIIEKIEAVIGEPVHLAAGSTPDDLPIRAVLRVTPAQANAFDLYLTLSADAARLLGEALPFDTEPQLADMAALPFPVAVLAGTTALTMKELRSLRPGDIVLFDERAVSGGVAVFAERYIAQVHHRANSLVLASKPQKIAGADRVWAPTDNLERNGMMTTNAPDMASLDDLPVRVHFEIGRQEIPLQEIRGMTTGTILPVAPLIDDAVNIVANGRIIGRGTITRLGEGLGVVITRLSGDE